MPHAKDRAASLSLVDLGTRLCDRFSLAFVMLGFTASALCGGTSLPPNLAVRAQRIYPEFVPPCCWRGSLADHQSPAATHLREEIDTALASGKSDSEIKQQVIHEYSKAILRVPEGVTGKVVFLVPVCIIPVSIVALSAVLVSWAKRSKVVPLNAAVDDRQQHWRKKAEADSQWEEFEGAP